jgi:kynureninase
MTPEAAPASDPAAFVARAAVLDAADPLASFATRFVQHDEVIAYLDGNSLGRPVAATRERLERFVEQEWGERLIRAWDEKWIDGALDLGDRLARVALGARAGQVVVADSTTVLLYKLVRAAVDAQPGRREIVADTENFPTDRYVLEGIAAERGLTLRWITPDPDAGVTVEEVRAAVGADTALVLLSHVAYKSGYIADVPAITRVAHEAGALVLWDLCHSAGSVPVHLDDDEVDLAVGCSYKYLNGGPGAPAFAYVAERLHGRIRQPVQGWFGAADPFAMGPGYEPASGIRQIVSGTPPILALQPIHEMVALIDEAGIDRIRAKSVQLTAFVIDYADTVLAPLGVRVATPRDPERRGSHVTIEHPDFRAMTARLWERGVIPDFRPPRGIRIGLSPLSTTFGEVARGLGVLRELLRADPDTAG